MSAPANPPAFPCKRLEPNPFRDEEFDRLSMVEATHPGMSLRDYFAGQALVALGNHRAVTARGIPWLAEHAYMVADAMLVERAK